MTPIGRPADRARLTDRLAEQVAESLHRNFRREARLSPDRALLKKAYNDLTNPAKRFWLEYSAGIPYKLNSLGLLLRPFQDFCRTCIITEEEISGLASTDLSRFAGESSAAGAKQFFLTLNYLVPASLKEAGYEIYRQEEAECVSMATARTVSYTHLTLPTSSE
ncbi:MAG: hypothetical protein QUS66_00575, partial [Bacteroidota bacterium]|nr:hypothetical protein [Bacteroidota bacterium]